MAYNCKQCGGKTMNYTGGANGRVHITSSSPHTPLDQRPHKMVPGFYQLDCANCGNQEVHRFNAPHTIQEQLRIRVSQDF